jgi:hypothetical protein
MPFHFWKIVCLVTPCISNASATSAPSSADSYSTRVSTGPNTGMSLPFLHVPPHLSQTFTLAPSSPNTSPRTRQKQLRSRPHTGRYAHKLPIIKWGWVYASVDSGRYLHHCFMVLCHFQVHHRLCTNDFFSNAAVWVSILQTNPFSASDTSASRASYSVLSLLPIELRPKPAAAFKVPVSVTITNRWLLSYHLTGNQCTTLSSAARETLNYSIVYAHCQSHYISFFVYVHILLDGIHRSVTD